MGIYLQRNGARSLIGGGGTKQLEKRVSAIEQGRASETAYGLVELCNSSAVTDSTGKALPASENNAGLPGTMANRIEAAKKSARYACSENTEYISNNWGTVFEKNNTVIVNIIMGVKSAPGYHSLLIATCPFKPCARQETQTVSDLNINTVLTIHENGEIYMYPRGDMNQDVIRAYFVFFKKQ